MQLVTDINQFSPNWESCVLTLGDFDGLHRGHLKLIHKAQKIAFKKKLPLVLLTYEPSPKKILGKLDNHSDIYTISEKIDILKKLNIDTVICYPFTKDIIKITAVSYLRNFLLKQLKAKYLVIGDDHCFGRNRRGNFKYLSLASKKYKFQVIKVKLVQWLQEKASSSKVRFYIKEGDVATVHKLLTKPYKISGSVIKGQQRGRLIGFPTANLQIENNSKILPKIGVYFTIMYVQNKYFLAVTNIGKNPTFNNQHLSIETYILNFNKDIYGENITLYFIERLRDEKKFNNIDELKQAISNDIEQTRFKNITKYKLF